MNPIGNKEIRVVKATKSNPAHIPIRNFNLTTHSNQFNSKCHANEVMPTYAEMQIH